MSCNGSSGKNPTTGATGLSVNATTSSGSTASKVSANDTVTVTAKTTPTLTNQSVGFTTTLGTLSSATALTGGNGEAIVQLTFNASDAGVATITATSQLDGSTDTIATTNVEVSSTEVVTPTLQMKNTNGDPVTQVTGGESVALEIVLKNAQNQPLSGVQVDWTTTAGTLSQSSVLSDVAGLAKTTLSVSNANIGLASIQATFTVDGSSQNVSKSLSIVQSKETPITIALLDQANKATTAILNSEVVTIQATVKDVSGNVIPNQTVNFATTFGALSKPSALTDSQGIATATIAFANTDTGVATLTLTTDIAGNTETQTAALDVSPSGAATIAISLLDDQCAAVTTASFLAGSTVCAQAKVTQNEQPVVGANVGFSSSIGTPNPISKLTDTQGIAQVSIDSTSSTLGAGTLTTTLSTGETQTTTLEFVSSGASSPGSAATPEVSLTMLESGVLVNRFQASKSVQLEATFLDEDDQPIENAIVTFTAGLGTLATSSALTTSLGKAQVTLNSDLTNLGAGTAIATASKDGVSFTSQFNYEITAAPPVTSIVKIGHFDTNNQFIDGKLKIDFADTQTGTPTISAGGTLSATAVIVDENNIRILTPNTITFSSGCVSDGKATIDATVTTINGSATATYEDINCGGATGKLDKIEGKVTINTVDLLASEDIQITGEDAGSIEFVSASPQSITLKGTGGVETSTLTFLVKGKNNNPLANQQVNFTASTTVGGIVLSPTTSLTNSQGLVTTVVNSGVVPTPLSVLASLTLPDNSVLQSQSSQLSINTGLPDQNSITFSPATINPEAADRPGETVNMTVFLSDSANNPVANNTTVQFIAESGQIPSQCTTTNGTCNVTWTSTQPVVGDHRATILAYVDGQETFFDTNGNGVFDSNDGSALDAGPSGANINNGFGNIQYQNSGWYDMAETFLDLDEDGIKNNQDIVLDEDGDGVYDAANGLFNGPNCTAPLLCASQKSIRVRKGFVLILSSSSAEISLYVVGTNTAQTGNPSYLEGFYVLGTNDPDANQDANLSIGSTKNPLTEDISLGEDRSVTLRVALADTASTMGQILPAGTTVGISSNVGALGGTTSFTIPNSIGANKPNTYGGNRVTFTLSNTNTTTVAGEAPVNGAVTVRVTFPSSNIVQDFVISVHMDGT